jgi:hypothetical protein
MENITLSEEVIKKINNNRMVRINNIEQEQNKICDKIYSSIIESIIENPISGKKVVNIPKMEVNNMYYLPECINHKRFENVKKQINVDFYSLQGLSFIHPFENLKFEYDFNKSDLICIDKEKK